MKRSRVNAILLEGDAFIRSFGYVLPPFAYFTPAEMQARTDLALLKERQMGWDVTDFGGGDYDRLGLFLFTVRNGNNADLIAGRGMLYAEKIMISKQDQITPMHRHNLKAEDIINRGGGTLTLELFSRAPDGGIDETAEVEVYCDGIARRMAGGSKLRLTPGESVTLLPNHWHSFWGEGADVLVAEVSTVNDDHTDNVFRDPVGRFAEIEEDEAPVHLLVADYDAWLKG
jgi:D-lyxose ketol-isomerase